MLSTITVFIAFFSVANARSMVKNNAKNDLSGQWKLVDGFTLENSWSEKVRKRSEKDDQTEFIIKSPDDGFYEYSVDFNFEEPVVHGGELVTEFTAVFRMVETPTFKNDGTLLGINLEDAATLNYWVSDSGNKIEYVQREGGAEGTLVTKTMKRVRSKV